MTINAKLTRELALLEELVVNFVLSSAARSQYKLGKVAKAELEPYTESISLLSGGYVQQKNTKLDLQQLKAYALYYLPINFAKLVFLIKQTGLHTELRQVSSSLKILDYGCGPGTGALASLFATNKDLQLSLFDASHKCVSFARGLLEAYETKTQSARIKLYDYKPTDRFDLVIAANVLNELTEQERKETLDKLLAHTYDNGTLILLEPALKISTQLLMSDRDRLLEENRDLSITFPCGIQTPCPMLKKNLLANLQHDDWCHGELQAQDWERPPLLRQIDEMLGFNKHRIKYTAMIFKGGGRSSTESYRLLRPGVENNSAIVCGPEGLLNINPRHLKNSKLKRLLKKGSSYSSIDAALLK